MIKKFQRRFILMAMAALLAVLILIIGGINVYNFHEVAADADELLHIISYNRGSFPEMDDEDLRPNRPESLDPHGGRHEKEFNRLSPETPYETRYFFVGINNETGEADLIETSKIVAVDQENAEKMARSALENEDDGGYLGEYRYYVSRARKHTFVVFVDCGRTLESAKRFLLGSVIISAGGYLLVFVIVSLLSRYAIRTMVTGYEKQKQFISNAGHELKTPLTIIQADTDILEMDFGENEWLTDIRRQVQRLSDLTGELSKLSRMEETSEPIQMAELDLSALAAEQARSFESPAKIKEQVLTSTIQPRLYLRGNEKALRQLCDILLDNAVKYAPDGAEIRLTLEKSAKQLRLCVENPSKLPLPTEDLDQLFERFYRTDPSRSSETGGLGLGLAVARAVAETHGGSIRANCPEGANLSIVVLLPSL